MSGKTEIKAGSTVSGLLRFAMAILLIFLQLAVMVLFVTFLHQYATYAYFTLQLVGVVCIIRLINKETSPSSKLAWSLLVLTLPVVGVIMYLFWGGNIQGKRQILKRVPAIYEDTVEIQRSKAAVRKVASEYPVWGKTARYLDRKGFKLYDNTDISYLSSGESMFESLIADLERAEKAIFLQYFIVAEGRIWNQIHEVLCRKAAQGVEVKLLYDDFGSILRFSDATVAQLRREGIEVVIFNPVHKYISRLYLNYRNHEKTAVIDGNVAYTGGINIGDEYANLSARFGYWKDTAIRMEGAGVWGLTKIFLEMWQMSGGKLPKGYDYYRPTISIAADGFCQPLSDGPLNNPDNPAEVLYMQMISGAKRYVYITSPYFAVEEGMLDALCTAAESGVDIRIILPAIPDHWYTYLVANSYYGRLIAHGVKVYEYTPGFMHSKTVVCDDEAAVVGSINMDYRSFRMHYECGVWMCGVPEVLNIVNDIQKVMEQCRQPDLEEWRRRPWYRKVLQQVLRIFSIFM